MHSIHLSVTCSYAMLGLAKKHNDYRDHVYILSNIHMYYIRMIDKYVYAMNRYSSFGIIDQWSNIIPRTHTHIRP